MRFKVIICFVLTGACLNAQDISAHERRWALAHPFAAIRVKSINSKCHAILNLKEVKAELDSFSNGGKLDAFRHVFFMAAFAQKIKVEKLRQLGMAHEKNNYDMFLNSRSEFGELPDSLGSVMDLQNNELAFKTGSANKTLSLKALEKLVIQEIKKGNAVIMKRNKDGAYLDCNDRVVDMKQYVKKWNIPKCLVTSDFDYP